MVSERNWKVKTKNGCTKIVFANGKPWRGTKAQAEALVRKLHQTPEYAPESHGPGVFGGISQTRFVVSRETGPGWKTNPRTGQRWKSRDGVPTGRYRVDQMLFV